MTTWNWVGGTGDWYAASNWTATPGGSSGVPQPGDLVTVTVGTLQISAADVSTYGTLDDIALTIGAAASDDSPVLDVANGQFGANFELTTRGTAGDALFNAQDALDYAGTINAGASAGTLTLAITPTTTNESPTAFQFTGQLLVTGGQTVLLADTADGMPAPLISERGTFDISAGTLAIGSDMQVAIGGLLEMTDGELSIAEGGAFNLAQDSGAVADLSGGALVIDGTLDVETGTTLTAVGDPTVAGVLMVGGAAAFGDLTNTGGINVGVGGSLTLTGTLDGGGTLAVGGSAVIGDVSGSATLEIANGGLAEIQDATGSGVSIDLGGRGAVLRIDDVAAFAGTIVALGNLGSIYLPDVIANGDSYDATDGLLNLTQDGTQVAALHMSIEPELQLSPGPTGTVLLQSPSLATLQRQQVQFITGLNAGGTLVTQSFYTWNGQQPPAYTGTQSPNKWGGGEAGANGGTIYYSFNPASDWTSAEQGAFVAGMALWSDIADVTFAPASDPSDATLVITRGTVGEGAFALNFYTPVAPGGTILPATQSSVLTIDTSQYAWSQVYSFSTAGGYGLTTVMHELGHVLGLGHAGFYNGALNADADQLGPYDSRLWTVMSYIQPTDPTALYYSDYPLDATRTIGSDRYQYDLTTFGMLDVQAIQQLYGAPTSTPLGGGQTFGFNSNVAGPAGVFYDFTVNTNPVITIWDEGTGNTLDLSGFTSASQVDLMPGTFSSVDGMTNNIGIAVGTSIDSVIGGPGNDIFTVNADSDWINGGGGINAVLFPEDYAAYVVDFESGGTVTVGAGAVTDTLTNIQTLTFADQSITVPCFASGTCIRTPLGEVAVETLAIGDLVTTLDGTHRPVIWIGRREIDVTRHDQPERVTPIRIRRGSFGEGVPYRDLMLSPDHAVWIDNVLIPVRCLIDGKTIAPHRVSRVTYYHIELDQHDVLFAEGLTAETYLDTGDRMRFRNATLGRLHPALASHAREARAFAPLVVTGPRLEAARNRRRRRGRQSEARSAARPDASAEWTRTDAPTPL
jgi:serralysin